MLAGPPSGCGHQPFARDGEAPLKFHAAQPGRRAGRRREIGVGSLGVRVGVKLGVHLCVVVAVFLEHAEEPSPNHLEVGGLDRLAEVESGGRDQHGGIDGVRHSLHMHGADEVGGSRHKDQRHAALDRLRLRPQIAKAAGGKEVLQGFLDFRAVERFPDLLGEFSRKLGQGQVSIGFQADVDDSLAPLRRFGQCRGREQETRRHHANQSQPSRAAGRCSGTPFPR
jgi:hypothetical protein